MGKHPVGMWLIITTYVVDLDHMLSLHSKARQRPPRQLTDSHYLRRVYQIGFALRHRFHFSKFVRSSSVLSRARISSNEIGVSQNISLMSL
jgi:hypothetical protein